MTIAQLPFGKSPKFRDFVLPERLVVEEWAVPAGTTVKLRSSENFGVVCLPPDCKSVDGQTIPQRLFRY